MGGQGAPAPASPQVGGAGFRGGAIRVLIDYRPARYGRGGIGVYVRRLTEALVAAAPDDHFVLFAEQVRGWPGRRIGPRRGRDVPGASVQVLDRPVPSRLHVAAARLGLGLEARGGGVDLVHWTDYTAAPPTRCPLVVTIHDVLFETLPACYTPGMRRGLRAATRRLVRAASRIIVPSARTARDLLAHHALDPSIVDVVPHGVSPVPEVEGVGGYGRYVLFVGTLEPRKNLGRLLEAHARLGGGVKLVVAGARGWMDDALVAEMTRRPDVVWEGPVGDERLAALYRGARAFAYPSLGEGFGLPVLEALSVGCPVLVAEGTMPADLAGDAGLAIDPRNASDLAAALEALARDDALHAKLARRAKARARPYTWERAAKATLQSYRKALGG